MSVELFTCKGRHKIQHLSRFFLFVYLRRVSPGPFLSVLQCHPVLSCKYSSVTRSFPGGLQQVKLECLWIENGGKICSIFNAGAGARLNTPEK